MGKYYVPGPSRVRLRRGKQLVIGEAGSTVDLTDREAAPLLEAGDIEPVKGGAKAEPKADEKPRTWKEKKAAAKEAAEPATKKWPLKTPPADYLEKYPDGPKAALAKEILGK